MEKLTIAKKDELLKRMRRYYRIGLQTNRKWIERARNGYEFYLGNQWDEADLKKCKEEKRPALTINKIFPVINTVSGIKRENKQDYTVYPYKGSSKEWAQVFTSLLKDTADDTEAEWEAAAMFDDGIITGKGWLALDVDYNEDPLQGDLTLERVSPFEVMEDRRDKHYNLNKGAEFVIRLMWKTKEEIQDEYPDAKLDGLGHTDLAESYGLPDASSEETDDYADTVDMVDESESEEDREEDKRYCVKQTWWKTTERSTVLVNLETQEVRRLVPKKAREYAETLADNYPKKYALLKNQRREILHVAVWVGNEILDYADDPLKGCRLYPLVRFCAYYMEGVNIGMVDNLVDPQQEHNKRRSQILHHLNSTAHSGWIGDEDALSETGWKNLEDFGSKPGVTIKKRSGKDLKQIMPVPESAGHFTMAEVSDNDIKDISGVNSQLQAQTPERKMSGKAIQLQQTQGIRANTMLFDNYNHTKIILGKTILEIMRKNNLYSPEEIGQIVDITEEMKAELVKGPGGRFKVKVDLSPQTPTVRVANYQTLAEMMSVGVPIHPRHLIAASDIPNKEEIIQDMMQMPPGGGGGPGGAAA